MAGFLSKSVGKDIASRIATAWGLYTVTMKELPVPNWPALMREPIILGLLLSACLHLAAIFVIQPSPGSGRIRTVVINARLETAASPTKTETPVQTESTKIPPRQTLEASQPAMLVGGQPSPDKLPVPQAPPNVAEVKTPITAAPPAPPAGNGSPSAAPGSPSVGPATASSLPSLPLGIDTTWYQARQVDVHPKAVGRVSPAYPLEARRRNQQGTLKLILKIDELGRVMSAEVAEADPPGVFEEAALEAFRNARFQPAMKDGRPVRALVYYRVDFRLED
jgi:periplasmic protein TonB